MDAQLARSPAPPRFKIALAWFIAAYLAAYYLQPQFASSWIFQRLLISSTVLATLALIAFSLILFFCQQSQKLSIWSCSYGIKYGSYIACFALAVIAGSQLRSQAEHQQNFSSLGMAAEKIQIYYGRVIEDARPSRQDGQVGLGTASSFRFHLELFASSDGRQLLSSARGRVLVRAAATNPIPSLGQLVAVQAPIQRLHKTTGPSILFSHAQRHSIQLFGADELPSPEIPDFLALSALEPFSSKAVAYLIGKGPQVRSSGFSGYSGPSGGSSTPSRSSKLSRSAPPLQFLSNLARNSVPQDWAVSVILERGFWSRFWQRLWQRRSSMRNALFRSLDSLFPAAGRDLFLALLFGSAEELPQQVKENFRLSGCMHILALSGFHVGILAGIVSFLLRPALGLRRSLLLSSLILGIYLWLVGPFPSLTRAVLMFLLLNGYKFSLRLGDSFLIWAISTFVQTQIFPSAALSLSFQLSYSAMLGLILFAGRCNTLALVAHHKLCLLCHGLLQDCPYQLQILQGPWRRPRHLLRTRLVRLLFQGIGVTLAVMLCSAPILIANFGQIQWIGLLASLVETPIITLYMSLSLLLWPLAHILQQWQQEVLLLLIQQAYSQVYYFSLAPMELFALARPWFFFQANGSLLLGQLVLYLSSCFALLGLLYRYELHLLRARLF